MWDSNVKHERTAYLYYERQNTKVPEATAVSHISQFGDANTSLAGDGASLAGDVNVSAGDAYL